MKKTHKKLSAFTLIELLIVIAIIGILATLMFPAIANVMDRANGVKLGNNGKNVVQGILSANIEREAMSKGAIWPSKGKWSDSNAYFARLLGSGGAVILDGISPSVFAGAGVPAAADADDLKDKGNVWNMTACDDSPDDATPFMMTRNLKGLPEDTFAKGQDTSATDLSTYLDASTKPFGAKQVVVVRRGGAMETIRAKYLDTETFLMGTTNSTIEVVEAKTDSATGEDNEF